MLAYFSAKDARSRFISLGTFTEETAPPVADLEEVLTILEGRLDDWMGYRAAPTKYTEILTSNARGFVLVYHYPVISVEKVECMLPHFIGKPQQFLDPSAVWAGKRTLAVGLDEGINYRVTYMAGLNPLPSIFSEVIFNLLGKAFKTGGLDFMDAPVRDLQNVALPGGLSQTYRIGGGGQGGSGGGGDTELGRALAPLSRYRRKLIT